MWGVGYNVFGLLFVVGVFVGVGFVMLLVVGVVVMLVLTIVVVFNV